MQKIFCSSNKRSTKHSLLIAFIILFSIVPAFAGGSFSWDIGNATSGTESTAGTVSLTVSMSGIDTYPSEVSVGIAGGTATEGSDYNFSSTTIQFFADGDQTVDFTVLDDVKDEDNQTIIFSLTSLTGGVTISGSSTHTYTITDDDDQPTISFAETSSSDDEQDGTASIAVTLSAASEYSISVNFSVTDGTATVTADYDAFSPTNLTFSPGSTTQYITPSLNEDALDEDAETIELTLSGPTNATLGTNTVHTFSIIDNDATPTIAFTSGSSSGNEGSLTADVQIGLSAVSGRDVSVNYSVNGSSTATGSGTDFTLGSGSKTIPAGQQYATIQITDINTDALYEADETVIIDLASPTNATLGGQTQFTFTIINTTALPVIQFTGTSSNGAENLSPATIEISSTQSGLDASIDYTVTGTATGGGQDYTLANGTATVTASSTTTDITIPIVNDLLDEVNETIILTLSNPSNATLGTNNEHTYTINDNDNEPTVGFSVTSSSVAEDAGTVSLTIGISAASGKNVSVDYVVSGGTATITDDYTYTAGTATITAGNTSTTISLDVVDDTVDEEDSETIIIQLSGESNATLDLAADEYTLSILDNDASPIIDFNLTASSGSEATSPASLTIDLSTASNRNVTVDYSATGGTATGADYTLVDGTATITAGNTSTTVDIDITNDDLDENNETIVVTLSDPSNASLGTDFTHTYTINDEDPQPSISFAVATGNGAESSSPVTITINLSDVSGLDASVGYTVTGITATGSGTDFTLADGTATISAGGSSTTLSLLITDDNIDENNETLSIEISSPSNATLGATTTYTYTINDNDDPPEIDFSVPTVSTSEGEGSLTWSLRLSAEAGLDASVDYTVVGGTATGSGGDYTLADGTATITAGNTSTNLTLNLNDDSLDERDETVVIVLTDPVNSTIGTNDTLTVTITDNDNPVKVAFQSASSTAPEGTSPHAVTVELSAISDLEVSADYTVTGGTADDSGDDIDFTLVAGTVTIPAGSTTETFDVTINDDLLDEAGETIIVTLSNPDSADLGVISEHIITISDNDDPPVIQFTATSATAGEGAGTISIGLDLSAESGQDATVDYTVTEITAEGDGTDFTLADGTATISAGATSTNIALVIDEDFLDEDDETLSLTISSPVNASLGANTTYDLEITDNDDLPDVAFSTNAVAGSENVTSVTVTINLNAASGRMVSVDYSIADVTASGSGVDYSFTDGTATFAAGETSKPVTLTIVDDGLDEINETAVITLTNPSNANIGGNSTYTYTIYDNDDQPTVAFAVLSSNGLEAVDSVYLDVQLSAESGKDISVDYAVIAGDATAGGVDYTLPAGTLNIAAGSTAESILAVIVDDYLVEDDEYFTVALSTPTNVTITTTNLDEHTYTITNDDSPPADFTVGSVVTDGGNVVSGWWNAANTSVTVTVPIENAADLNGGEVQILAKTATGGYETVGDIHSILVGELGGSAAVILTDTQFETISFIDEQIEVFLSATITDAYGNSTTGTYSGTTITVDRGLPDPFTVADADPTGGSINSRYWNKTNTGATISIPLADDGTLTGGTIQLKGRVGTNGFVDLGTPVTISSGWLDSEENLTLSAAEIEGLTDFGDNEIVQFSATITDIAGNAQEGTAGDSTFLIDQSPATVAVAYSHTLASVDTIVEIEAVFNEILSSPPYITVDYAGAGDDEIAQVMTIVGTDSANWTYETTIPSGEANDGDAVIEIAATDIALNDSTLADTTLVIDNTIPSYTIGYENITQPTLDMLGKGGDEVEITVTFSEPVKTGLSAPTLDVQYADSTDDSVVDIPAGSSSNGDSVWVFNITLPIGEENSGELTVGCTANDLAGNEAINLDIIILPPATLLFMLDNTPPAAFATGAFSAADGKIVSGWINSTNDSIQTSVPTTVDDIDGEIYLAFAIPSKMDTSSTWEEVGSPDIVISSGTKTVYRTVAEILTALNNVTTVEQGDTILVRARKYDEAGNVRQGIVSEDKLVYDVLGPSVSNIIEWNETSPDTIISQDSLTFSWGEFTEPTAVTASGMERYEWIITYDDGLPGADTLVDFTSSGLTTAADTVLALTHLYPYTIAVRAWDVAGNVSSANLVSDPILRLNSAPIITLIDSTVVYEDIAYSDTVEFSDLDIATLGGDEFTYTLETDPVFPGNSALQPMIDQEGIITFTPTPVDTGLYDFTVYIDDNWGFTDTLVYVVNALAINDTPVVDFRDTSVVIVEDSVRTIQVNLDRFITDEDNELADLEWYGYTILDTVDNPGYPLGGYNPELAAAVRAETPVLNAVAPATFWAANPKVAIDFTVVNDSNYAVITADTNYFGALHRLIFYARDLDGATAQDTMILDVESRNDRPQLTAIDDQEIFENDSLLIDFGEFAYDVDDTALTFTISALTNAAFITFSDTNYVSIDLGDTIVIKPDDLWSAETTIRVIATDDSQASDTVDFALDIIRVDRPHLTIALIQNSAFTSQLEVIVNDTMEKAIDCQVLLETDRINLDTVSTHTYIGRTTIEQALEFTVTAYAEALVGDTTISRDAAVVLAKAGGTWSGASRDGTFRISGEPGAVVNDQYILVVDTSLFAGDAHQLAKYRMGALGVEFDRPLVVTIDTDDPQQAVYRSTNGADWEELPSLPQDGAVVAWTAKSGYFGLGPATLIVPEETALHHNYPNPFNPSTTIVYDLGFFSGPDQRLVINVYDILGRRVLTLYNGRQSIGQHEIRWDGRNGQGVPVASGIYFVQMRAGRDFYSTQKVMLLR